MVPESLAGAIVGMDGIGVPGQARLHLGFFAVRINVARIAP